ncbi:MAG: EutN/CcmL family microcompartment protein [Acidobacteriota bacterium]|nr:EutN/CcmL family microcompartment protein [Acidobacteriota bacterium]
MRIARIVATVVATQKHDSLVGAKLLVTQPVGSDGHSVGPALLAVDVVGAGVGELVLLVLEGRAARSVLERRGAPVDAAVVGIVDPPGRDVD